MNKAEQFVANLCEQSFFSLWSYPNPQRANGKELCDCLVVCDPDVIIISVKEVTPTDSGCVRVDWDRWQRRAIEASVRQIFGAERILGSMSSVITKDGKEGLCLPPPELRRIHRVSVSLGGEGTTPLVSGEFERRYVHVFDRPSFEIVMRELDTITDFANYLNAKEEVGFSASMILESGGEENLLALYLSGGRSFPKGHDLMIVGEGIWKTFSESPEYQRKTNADKISYAWDNIIAKLLADFESSVLMYDSSLEQIDTVVRVMAREDRYCRRMLAKAFLGFLADNQQGETRSRVARLGNGVSYVFLACPPGTDQNRAMEELNCRCFVARGRSEDQPLIIGIAVVRAEQQDKMFFGVVYLRKDAWTNADENAMKRIQSELGYFANPNRRRDHEDEYPQD